ncbi:Exodeoxyribonuclease 7 large subunit, partial [human gut metagenome]
LGIPALQFLHKQKSYLQELLQTLTNASKERCNAERHSLALLAQQLESLNPLQIMVKGFAKVEHDNEPITSV